MTPLVKVVKAAIVDTYGNISEQQELFSHWAARGLKKLQRETLDLPVKKVMLQVNKNTRTATLPISCEHVLFVGMIDDRGRKVAFKKKNKIADTCNIVDVTTPDVCPTCGQDTSICEDLSITEDVELVVINNSTYENKTVKKMYPNGDYYLEKTVWYLDVSNNTVSSRVDKEFITNFGLKPCGCLETDLSTIDKIRQYCPDTYSCYYSCACSDISDYYYNIFDETGLIQFDFNFPYAKVYVEFLPFMEKIGGQYVVPEVAFETLVEWTKWRAIKDKKGVEKWRIDSAKESFEQERGNMNKIQSRVSLDFILNAARSIPKFNVEYDYDWYSCFSKNSLQSALSGVSGGSSIAIGGGGGTVVENPAVTLINTHFQLAVRTGDGPGHPVNDTNTYQNNVLKNATDINYIILAKQLLTKLDGDFTFDSSTGIITLTGLKFFTPDSLIIPYNKVV